MTEPVQAPSLSSKQTHQTLGSLKKKPMKATLCNPYSIVWPHVPKEDASFVLELLERTFNAVELRKTSQIMRKDHHTEYKAFKKLKRQQKKEQMKKLIEERDPEEINLMSRLVLGFQKVNKFLERDELCLVLATRESWSLIQHLAMLVGIRRCPGMAVPGLEGCLADKLGVSKLSVLGFKKKHLEDSDRFDELIMSISAKCPPITIPWAELESELNGIKKAELSKSEAIRTTCVPEADTDHVRRSSIEHIDNSAMVVTTATSDQSQINSHSMVVTATTSDQSQIYSHRMDTPVDDSVKDYSHLYLYKADTKKQQTIIFENKNDGQFVGAKYDGIDNLDFVTVEKDGKDKKSKRKNPDKLKGNSKKMKPSRSSWQEMDVGRIVPNINRKSKKKKSKS